jgi:hypothetical protein
VRLHEKINSISAVYISKCERTLLKLERVSKSVRFQVITEANMKMTAFWDVV